MTDPSKPVTITVDLTPSEALAFAQFLKRVGHNTFLRHSDPTDKEEPYQMAYAAGKLQMAFAQAGYSPR